MTSYLTMQMIRGLNNNCRIWTRSSHVGDTCVSLCPVLSDSLIPLFVFTFANSPSFPPHYPQGSQCPHLPLPYGVSLPVHHPGQPQPTYLILDPATPPPTSPWRRDRLSGAQTHITRNVTLKCWVCKTQHIPHEPLLRSDQCSSVIFNQTILEHLNTNILGKASIQTHVGVGLPLQH